MPFISVVICTHNPRQDYLRRTLDGLKGQTLPRERWEVLLIDNASKQPLVAEMSEKVDRWEGGKVGRCEGRGVDLSWHPNARVVREDKLGLTHARLRGIGEAKGELLLFVDDDNVLAPDYLEVALKIAGQHPNLGVWSGQAIPEFEVPPPVEIEPFLGVLCIRRLTRDVWSNARDTAAFPYGAGMVVRSGVAQAYANDVVTSAVRLGMGRRGESLASSEDLDMALTGVDLGLGTGLFKELVLTHLIGAKRLTRNYILKLIEDSACGHAIFEKERDLVSSSLPQSGIDSLVAQYKLWRATPMQKAVAAARARGLKRAKQLLQ